MRALIQRGVAWLSLSVMVLLSSACSPQVDAETVAARTIVVTETVTAQPEPAPTVTVTEYVTVEPSPPPEPVEAEPVYVAPDPAAVRVWLRPLWREGLGREPGDSELASWVDFFMELHASGVNAEARVLDEQDKAYQPERNMIRDQERAREEQQRWEDTSDMMSCAADPDQPRCEED